MIEPTSARENNFVLVNKQDLGIRFCMHHWSLNLFTNTNNFPLPRIDSCLDYTCIWDSQHFSTHYLRQVHFQVLMASADINAIVYIARKETGHSRSWVLGYVTHPVSFSGWSRWSCQDWLGHLSGICYDIIVFSRTFEEHMGRLYLVFERLGVAKLNLKPSKCKIL